MKKLSRKRSYIEDDQEVTDEMVDATTIIGTPEECAAQMKNFFDDQISQDSDSLQYLYHIICYIEKYYLGTLLERTQQ